MEPVDFSVLNEFRELMGEDGDSEVRDLVNLYLEDGPVQLAAMQEALQGSDAESFRRAAHSFKSSSANIGAFGLQSICQTLEQKTVSGNFDGDVSDSLAQAESGFSQVKSALQSYLE